MGRSQRATAAQTEYCKANDPGVHEIENYRAREHGNSMVSTLSPTALSLLDIAAGDELTHYIDVDRGLIIIDAGDRGE